ncbi:MAG: bifunctional DNA primase/polymerase [Planctomycetes bacterium]|nr:bifunctional DNA primase/polymerase [Planctomycetota bacterium]
MECASTSRLEAAREYLGLGYMPLPVPRQAKGCVLDNWTSLRFSEAELPQYFSGEGNVGLALGEVSGWLVDVDLDCDEAIALAPKFLPATEAKTGRASAPNSHWWYIASGAVTKKHKDPITGKMIVEFRSNGQQTLVGPSIHPKGEPYDWLKEKPGVADADYLAGCVAALAAAVVKKLHPDLAARTPPGPTSAATATSRSSSAPADSVVRRASAYLAAMPPAISGNGGHSRTYAAATALVHGFGLDQHTAMRLLLDEYNPRCEPPWTDKDLLHKISDASSKPHERPYGWLRDSGFVQPILAPASADQVVATHASSCQRPFTDLGNAERLADAYANRLRYCASMGQWLEWDGRRWRRCTPEVPRYLMTTVSRGIANAAAAGIPTRARSEWAHKSESRSRIDAAVSLACSLPAFAVDSDQLDADPWAFNVENGTLDLRTGAIGPHDQEQLITKLAPVIFDAEAKCPRFEAFLNRIFDGDESLQEFVLGLLGMCLSGDCREQRLPIFFGCGANGKSVLVDTTLELMGDYACVAPPDLLVCSQTREHATEIADLMGRRLVVASETESGAHLKIQRMKQLTGDKLLKGRFMRQDFFSFVRTHKTLLVTNNKPLIREESEAVWRRILLVPFSVVIPAEERNANLLDELKAEWPGILATLVRAGVRWQHEPMPAPNAVLVATAGYREQEDGVGRFVAERCEVEQGGVFTAWKELHECYRGWCSENGEQPLSATLLGEALAKRGCETATKWIGGRAAKVRLGIVLRPLLFKDAG